MLLNFLFIFLFFIIFFIQESYSYSIKASSAFGLSKRYSLGSPKLIPNEFDPFKSGQEVLQVDRNGNPWVPQLSRPRRNRRTEAIRSLVRENQITVNDLMYPLFIQEEDGKEEISSMPDCYRLGLPQMMQEVQEAIDLGVKSFILFPKISKELKSNFAEEAYNPHGLVPRALSLIKEKFPDVVVATDVALDPYSIEGHDGVVDKSSLHTNSEGKLVDIHGNILTPRQVSERVKVLNDLTIAQLQKQSIMHARAGADYVAPSDMMDGRIGAIRLALDSEGHTNTGIIAYTAKYASSYYGPFRDALASHPGMGDKRSYQQDPSNGRESLIEANLDEAEGADVLLVKPGLPYLDVILRLRQNSNLPIAAYHVSGEYSMLKAAVQKGWLNEKETVMETMTCFKRAGADIILTYYAKQVAQWLKDGYNN